MVTKVPAVAENQEIDEFVGDRPEDAAEEHHLHDQADDDEQNCRDERWVKVAMSSANALIGVVDFCVSVELGVEMRWLK